MQMRIEDAFRTPIRRTALINIAQEPNPMQFPIIIVWLFGYTMMLQIILISSIIFAITSPTNIVN